MTAELLLARWQFGITTVYHFFFVPVTISMSLLVAVLQTMWVRTGNERYLRLTKFFGKLFLINFAMGVVTGIVQEFQFGLNWSEYSRFVGDIFGAPLALEALISFFLESVFLGLWIFGWDKLPKKVHLATIWLGALGTLISSMFILIANSWMQNPVGATYNPATKRAEMTDFLAVLTNPLALTVWPHVVFGGFIIGGSILFAVGGWWLVKIHREADGELTDTQKADVSAHRFAARFGAAVAAVAFVCTFLAGHFQGQIIVQVQPMKMAAQEAIKDTGVSNFAVLAWPDGKGSVDTLELPISGLGSFVATNSFDAEMLGFNDLQQSYTNGELVDPSNKLNDTAAAAGLLEKYKNLLNATGYIPDVLVTFYSFRVMMALGGLNLLIAACVLILTRKDKTPKGGKLWTGAMIVAPIAPLFASSFGWIATEMGRQPWIVNGVLPTAAAVSPGVSALEVGITLALFTLIYGVGAVIEVGLFLKTIKSGLPVVKEPEVAVDDNAPMSFAY
ncbi:MAG: cytochrome ubiquinol oxidase subunit I [Propionibacteriaceae bacterium]|jgi:cytochrome d ubiquinol oxidase subunit I|nr:cytochrome ubiquinol oxidase subunit I [Propionibacteriaceae bacterium]